MLHRPTSACQSDAALFQQLIPAVIEAGEAILRLRAAGARVEAKADASPVTEADRTAEAMIVSALNAVAPGIPVVAEEEVSEGRIPTVTDAFFLVDALDGTKDFLRGGPDFTVNIGLARGGSAVAGLIHAPAFGRLWLGVVGEGARALDAATGEAVAIAVRRPPAEALDIVASRSHRTPETDAFIARFPGSRTVAAGSSLKLVALAEGRADLYPRLAQTSQWDTAAGDALLAAAGGCVLDMSGAPRAYG
jgi:3'(2'), 5'-bisphosphate nucleotidase